MKSEGLGPYVNRMQAARIPPLPDDEKDDAARALLDVEAVAGARPANVFNTLVRHQGLFRRWVPFAGKLLAGRLPARDRELMILRTAWRCHSLYEWGQHVLVARAVGVSDAEIAAVRAGPSDPRWSGWEAALLAAVDELHDDSMLSDRTWAVLVGEYDERQLIEVPMLIGHYHMVAFALNSLQIEPDAGLPGFE